MEESIKILTGYNIDQSEFTKFYLANRDLFIDSIEHFRNYFELNPSGIFVAVKSSNNEIIGKAHNY